MKEIVIEIENASTIISLCDILKLRCNGRERVNPPYMINIITGINESIADIIRIVNHVLVHENIVSEEKQIKHFSIARTKDHNDKYFKIWIHSI